MALKGIDIDEKLYYSAKLHLHEETKEKSQDLVKSQRILKTKLEKDCFKFITSGNVRISIVDNSLIPGTTKYIFREKGVDVKIAVDLVVAACDKITNSIILCSSDSDLQPAIKEARNRDINITYLGFENAPNKGLTYTTNRTILFRNSEIMDSYQH